MSAVAGWWQEQIEHRGKPMSLDVKECEMA
jgi:hypothetical protein